MRGTKSISHRISLIARLQRTRFDARARSLGITLAQWRAIFAISCDEGTSQRRIAETIEVSDVTTGRLIDRLVDNGWAERRADPTDRRSHRVYLTRLAGPMLDELSALAIDEDSVALAGISDEERAIVTSVLERVIANLEAAAEPGESELWQRAEVC
ncbi:MAG: MarR family transcriptional regulator [Sphingobium sp.]